MKSKSFLMLLLILIMPIFVTFQAEGSVKKKFKIIIVNFNSQDLRHNRQVSLKNKKGDSEQAAAATREAQREKASLDEPIPDFSAGVETF